jgi:hypothetical protein
MDRTSLKHQKAIERRIVEEALNAGNITVSPKENLTDFYLHLPKNESNSPHCPLLSSEIKYEDRELPQISNHHSPLFHKRCEAHV